MILSENQIQILHDTARKSIQMGLSHRSPLKVHPENYDRELQKQAATFVTLMKRGQLRGCVGVLQAHRPLIEDVASNAFQAAFNDSRFEPVRQNEIDDIEISISILTEPVLLPVSSEEDLLRKLNPHRDGVILSYGRQRATFLPVVWEDLPDPKDFIKHLKLKAGLAADFWSDEIKIQVYQSVSFSPTPKRII